MFVLYIDRCGISMSSTEHIFRDRHLYINGNHLGFKRLSILKHEGTVRVKVLETFKFLDENKILQCTYANDGTIYSTKTFDRSDPVLNSLYDISNTHCEVSLFVE